MPTYQGGCHCGAVRFELTRDVIDRLVDCDCSICTRKGILHCPVDDEGLHVLSGGEALALYQFGSRTAEHRFCRHCGIHVLGRPRMNPGRYTVNARCLDDFAEIVRTAEIVAFDGQNHPRDAEGAG